jgi:methylthioribose-1-phosphate isomerase
MLALAARDNQVPFFAVVPTSTVDLSLGEGKQIPIEQREPGEVLGIQFLGKRASPETARARNPAFDITPHRLISGIITENGVVFPPYERNLRQTVQSGRS